MNISHPYFSATAGGETDCKFNSWVNERRCVLINIQAAAAAAEQAAAVQTCSDCDGSCSEQHTHGTTCPQVHRCSVSAGVSLTLGWSSVRSPWPLPSGCACRTIQRPRKTLPQLRFYLAAFLKTRRGLRAEPVVTTLPRERRGLSDAFEVPSGKQQFRGRVGLAGWPSSPNGAEAGGTTWTDR